MKTFIILLVLVVSTASAIVGISALDNKFAREREASARKNPVDNKVSMDLCLNACLKNTFKMFHSSPDTWGASASSMDGLGDSNVLDKVKSHCADIYEGKACCTGVHYGEYKQYEAVFLHPSRGREYGYCK